MQSFRPLRRHRAQAWIPSKLSRQVAPVLFLFAVAAATPASAIPLLSEDTWEVIERSPRLSMAEKLKNQLVDAAKALFAKDFAQAEVLARRVAEATESPDAYHLLGYALANLERFDEALTALEKASQGYENNVGPIVTQGEIHEFLGDTAKAREAYGRALVADPASWRAQARLGAMASAEGSPEKAIELLTGAINSAPSNRAGLGADLERAYAAAGRSQQAVPVLQSLTQQQPESASAWEALGRTYVTLGAYEPAIEALQRAVNLAPTSADLYSPLAVAYKAQGQLVDERRALDRALTLRPGNATIRARLGQNALAQGNAADAIADLEAAVAPLPADEVAERPELAAAYLAVGRPEDAYKVLSPWSSLPQNTPDTVIALLGRAAEELGRRNEAQRYFEARLGPAPSLTALVDLAVFQRRGLDFAAAEKTLQRATRRYPESAVPWLELGRVYGGEGRYDAALAAFEQGLTRSPNEPALLKGASLAQLRLGNTDAALDLAQQITTQPTAASSDYVWLGSIEETRGNAAGATQAYQAAVALNADDWVAQNNLAALLSASEPAQAVIHARAAARQAGQVAAVRDTLGWALYQNGQLDEAEQVYAALAKSNPGQSKTAYRHGLVLLKQGKTPAARAEIERALALDASFDDAAAARATLATLQ